MQAMHIDDLPDGRNQPFYQCATGYLSMVRPRLTPSFHSVLNSAGGSTYVAHENVMASFLFSLLCTCSKTADLTWERLRCSRTAGVRR